MVETTRNPTSSKKPIENPTNCIEKKDKIHTIVLFLICL
jgi:hypothetical protein